MRIISLPRRKVHPTPPGECSAIRLYCVHHLFSLCSDSFTTFKSVMLCRAVPCCAVLCLCSCLSVIHFSLFLSSSSVLLSSSFLYLFPLSLFFFPLSLFFCSSLNSILLLLPYPPLPSFLSLFSPFNSSSIISFSNSPYPQQPSAFSSHYSIN